MTIPTELNGRDVSH